MSELTNGFGEPVYPRFHVSDYVCPPLVGCSAVTTTCSLHDYDECV